MRAAEPGWTWSTAWRAVADPAAGAVVVSAGGDHVYRIDGLDPDAADAVGRWSEGGPAVDVEPALHQRLVGLGALLPRVAGPPTVVRVEPLGPMDGPAATAVADALSGLALDDVAMAGTPDDDVDLLVWVRGGSSLEEGMGTAPGTGALPVLLVDLAYHDVVGVGPWWVPPGTACPWCYLGRLRHRWGDHPVPATPAATRWPAVVAGLLGIQLEAIAAGRSTLANASVTWDLRGGRSDRQTVLKVPWCPTCEALG